MDRYLKYCSQLLTSRKFLFCVPIVALAWYFKDLIFLGRFFSDSDISAQVLPYVAYLGHNGPLISQEILFGFPLHVSIDSGWFYPVNTVLFSIFSATTAYTLLTVANMVLAYVFTYLFARKIQITPVASILSALVFIFSSQVMLGSFYLIDTGFYFTLPAGLYFLELALGSRSWCNYAWLTVVGIFLGMGWLSSHVQFVVYIHSFFFVYVLFRVVWSEGTKAWVKALRALVVPYLVSLLVGLPSILAILSFQPETTRAGGVPLRESVFGGYLPWDMLHFVLPFWNVNYVTAGGNLYLGILPLLLLLVAFFSYRSIKHPYLPLFLLTFLFCFIASFRYSPLAFILHYLPLYNAFRNSSEIMFIGEFVAALTIGIALDYVVHNQGVVDFYKSVPLRWYRFALLYCFVPLVAVVTLIKIFFFNTILTRLDSYFLLHVYPHTTKLPKEHYFSLINTYLHQALDQFTVTDTSVLVLLTFSAASLFLFASKKRVVLEHFAALAIILTALNFALVYTNFFPTVPVKEIVQAPETASHILALQTGNASPFRVFSVLPGSSVFDESVRCSFSLVDSYRLNKEFLVPDMNMLYGIDLVGGFDAYMPTRVSNALAYTGAPGTLSFSALYLKKISLEDKINTIVGQKNVLASMNVKYVISSTVLTDPDLVGVYSEKVGTCGSPLYVYQLKTTWPRYFVTNHVVQTKVDSEDADAALGEVNTYTKPVVILDTPVPKVPAQPQTYVTEVLPTYTNDTTTFNNVSCSTDCLLYVGNAFLPGWSVLVDGQKGTILRTNYLFMAVPLAKGTHTVELRYAKPLPW